MIVSGEWEPNSTSIVAFTRPGLTECRIGIRDPKRLPVAPENNHRRCHLPIDRPVDSAIPVRGPGHTGKSGGRGDSCTEPTALRQLHRSPTDSAWVSLSPSRGIFSTASPSPSRQAIGWHNCHVWRDRATDLEGFLIRRFGVRNPPV